VVVIGLLDRTRRNIVSLLLAYFTFVPAISSSKLIIHCVISASNLSERELAKCGLQNEGLMVISLRQTMLLHLIRPLMLCTLCGLIINTALDL